MKKKVLIVTSPLRVGGFDVVATSLQMHLDRERFECTYYIVGDEVGPLEPKVIESGAKVIHRPSNVRGYLADYKYLKKVIREGKYDAVHSHLMFFSGLVMLAARSEGVPVRVPHGHMTDPCIEDRSFLQRRMFDVYRFFMTLLLDSCGTALVACGPESGAYLYGKRTFKRRGIILNNGIDLSKYKFDSEMRERKRRELGVENKLVVGHVGRLNYIKNHKFLLDVFAELKKINADAVLLIVGEGEEKEAIEEKARRLGIENSVILTGVRDDVYDLLQAMDVFVFPSLKEGLPVTLIEAQATKLPCLISDTVSRYAKQNDNVEYASFSLPASEWAKHAQRLASIDRESVSVEKLIKNYDINETAKQLEKIYEGAGVIKC